MQTSSHLDRGFEEIGTETPLRHLPLGGIVNANGDLSGDLVPLTKKEFRNGLLTDADGVSQFRLTADDLDRGTDIRVLMGVAHNTQNDTIWCNRQYTEKSVAKYT